MKYSAERDADSARMSEPLWCVAIDEAIALAACVILMDHWAKPIDHLPFCLDRARGCRVENTSERRDVVSQTN